MLCRVQASVGDGSSAVVLASIHSTVFDARAVVVSARYQCCLLHGRLRFCLHFRFGHSWINAVLQRCIFFRFYGRVVVGVVALLCHTGGRGGALQDGFRGVGELGDELVTSGGAVTVATTHSAADAGRGLSGLSELSGGLCRGIRRAGGLSAEGEGEAFFYSNGRHLGRIGTPQGAPSAHGPSRRLAAPLRAPTHWRPL